MVIGVLQVDFHVPGARQRRDVAAAQQSVRDRLLHRFDVTVLEIPDRPPGACRVLITTAGLSDRDVRARLDRCVQFIERHPFVVAGESVIEVFPWEPKEGSWEERMMAAVSNGWDDEQT